MGHPAVDLVSELLKTGGDDGQALVDAVSNTYGATQDNKGEIDALKGQLTDADGNPIDLSNLGNGEEIASLKTDVKGNSDEITELDGRVADNERDLDKVYMDTYGTPRGVEMQHEGLDACAPTAMGSLNLANCANERSLHNEADIDGIEDKLMDKADYIGNLGEAIGVDPVTGEGTGEDGMSRIDMNYAIASRADGQSKANAAEIGMDNDGLSRIDHNEKRSMDNEMEIGMDDNGMSRIDHNEKRSMDNEMEIGMDDDGMSRIDHNEAAIFDAEGNSRIAANAMAASDAASAASMAQSRADAAHGLATSNGGLIRGLDGRLDTAESNIMGLRGDVNGLQGQMEIVRAGVAASMALAGMPAINGRGIAIGVGSYDGESAFAVGFQIQGEQASFKIGVTSSGGETGASAGVGFNF